MTTVCGDGRVCMELSVQIGVSVCAQKDVRGKRQARAGSHDTMFWCFPGH